MEESNVTISAVELNSGEWTGLGVLEITSIPDFSIINGRFSSIEQANAEYRKEILSLLAELYQTLRSRNMPDAAFEMVWLTHPVENQPYSAAIQLFLLVHCIAPSKKEAINLAGALTKLCQGAFAMQRYDVAPVDVPYLFSALEPLQGRDALALVREESIENLQNQMLPQCYSYDLIPTADNELVRLVDVLTTSPACAVFFQLIPTTFTDQERELLGKLTQTLDTLSKGVMDQGVGTVSFTAAQPQAELYRHYDNGKNGPLFQFHVLAVGAEERLNTLASRIYGQLSAGSTTSLRLKTVRLSAEEFDIRNNFYPMPWAIGEILMQRQRLSGVLQGRTFSGCYRLPFIVTGEEASELFRLPIGSDRIAAGLNVNEVSKDSKTYRDHLINSAQLQLGKLKSSAQGDSIGISVSDLAKHMLVVGTPGSGKTTFSVGLLDRLWNEHHIPFLVIEPAKNEYRALIQSIPDLQVFTPGKNFISPFVFNPFVPPENVKLETYKSTLKTAFSAAVSMTTPLDKIFEESINNCYSDFRWLDTYTTGDGGKNFNISDFIKCFQETFDQIGYTGDAKNIGRAGTVRLKSLVNLFDNYHSIPIKDLLSKPTVIELAAIENSDEKALLISLLLLSILAYVNSNYTGEGGLRNVILLEEAHVLLDAQSNGGQGDANPSAIAQGLVKRMLAEIRSYGVGLIVADQSPRKVSTDVVGLTDVKVCFRLVEASDRQILADSINMNEAQTARLTRLKPGEAFLFFNKLDEPEEIVTPDYRLENKINITLSDESIRALSTYWNDKQELLRPYPQCQCVAFCKSGCNYYRRCLAREISRRIFVRNFKPDSMEFELVRAVFAHISKLTMAELNSEPFNKELLACVKAQLWRRIQYGTKIPISEKTIEASLRKA